MFVEDQEWNDEPDAQAPSKTVLNNTQKTNSTIVKAKGVGKKSLLRTLKTLGSVPNWKSDVPREDSDSETEAVQTHTKRKKKRSKRRKQADVSAAEVDNVNLDPGGNEEKTGAKKLKNKDIKSGSSKVKRTGSVKADRKEIPKAVGAEVKNEENTEKLSRQQWRNKTKMKTKRSCKNKYRPNKPETTEKHNSEEQLKVDSHSNNSERLSIQTPARKRQKEKEYNKPQKRKKVEEGEEETSASDTQTPKEDNRLKKMKGGDHVETGESPGQQSKMKVGESQGGSTDDQQHPTPPGKRQKPEEIKEQIRKREKLRKLLLSQGPDDQRNPAERKDEDEVTHTEEGANEASADRSASLRSRMEQRLESARFRYINEVLYTTSSGEAKRMFKQDPQAFGIYHRGFTAQVQRWPANPVDAIISYIRHKPATLVVADFGCGDCKIARSVKNKVHSFDLAPICDLVTVCDMAHVPLGDGTVDIAVFCLSLMGINLGEFLVEASRVLVIGGVLKIAEVASRFDNVRSFLSALASLGFTLSSKDTENSHFYSFEFEKTGDAPENVKKSGLELKPCVYKKR